MYKRQPTHRCGWLQGTPLAPGCELAHGICNRLFLPWHMEVFLQLWDEMDDWFGACRHLLRSLT
jgi:hypothetical protein